MINEIYDKLKEQEKPDPEDIDLYIDPPTNRTYRREMDFD